MEKKPNVVEQTPVVENTTTTPEVIPPKEKDTKQILLIAIIVLLLTLLLLSVGIMAYQKGYLDNIFKKDQTEEQATGDEETTNDQEVTDTEEEQTEETDTTQTEQEKATETLYKGTTIQATVPTNWTVEEYYDGDGTDSLPDGTTWEGLTGLKIKKDSVEKFSVRAVSGIGFIGCPSYAKFSDYSPAHLAENQSIVDEIGDTMNILDYTNADYAEFEWLGTTFRRIGFEYFYDEQEGNSYFESPCVTGVLSIEGLDFTDSDGNGGGSYFYGAASGASNTELLTIDEILGSMKLL